ncbi:MAG TPA: L,D-transpeptidase [Chthoniobacterales bacterium]|nr:L,D-transpeptidase [Chthoniobacterales bacterium]
MKATTRLALALVILGLTPELRAQRTAVLFNLTEQTAYLLENGRAALVSPIASGKEGWGTPTGRFQIIKKDLNHVSGDFGLVVDSYGRIVNPNATPGSPVPVGCHYMPAPMPDYMQFGPYLGMHAGFLPGYPASHGCVRMPHDLAAEFFARVEVGTPVEVIGSAGNVTHVRRAIPLVQPGDSGRGPNPYEVVGSARNVTRVRRAIPVVQPGDFGHGSNSYFWARTQ